MSSDLSPLPVLPLGIYQHYKGPRYQVHGLARHSETLEVLVFYHPLDGERAWWVRPYDMFTGTLVVDGVERQRFVWVGPAPNA